MTKENPECSFASLKICCLSLLHMNKDEIFLDFFNSCLDKIRSLKARIELRELVLDICLKVLTFYSLKCSLAVINQCSFRKSCLCVHVRYISDISGALWLRDLPIHHSPRSAVSRGEDGSSKLGPRGRIRLPLSCVWHRQWVSVSPTTQTSEDPPAQSGPGVAFTSPPLSVIGSLSHSACVGSVFSTICLPGRGWCERVCVGGGSQRKEGIGVQQLLLMRLSRSKQLKAF